MIKNKHVWRRKMARFEYVITDPNGLHARPAGLLVKRAQGYDREITLECNGKTASLKRLLAVMGMGIRCGDRVAVTVEGEGATRIAEELKRFFEENF
jgi:phosphocarrier protein